MPEIPATEGEIMTVSATDILNSSILVVDDEPVNTELLSQMLEDEGYTRVTATTDPRQVTRLHQEQGFDLILLDMRMPHMSGGDVLVALGPAIEQEWTPVIVLTAQIDEETRLEALRAGARDFLTKPFRQWEVLLRIRNMLESRHFYKRQRIRADELEDMVQVRTEQIRQTKLMIIERLGRAGEFRDNDTGNHVARMSLASEALALAIGLSPRHAELIRFASPMHDIGKIGIPDRVLLKPGKLDPEERIIMNRHSEIGFQIIGDHADEILTLAGSMALHHHEKWDGSGYPRGLKGHEIPLEARIFSICDVFDALTSPRPYKAAWSDADAAAYLSEHAGTQFDPELVAAFHGILPQVIALRTQLPD